MTLNNDLVCAKFVTAWGSALCLNMDLRADGMDNAMLKCYRTRKTKVATPCFGVVNDSETMVP